MRALIEALSGSNPIQSAYDALKADVKVSVKWNTSTSIQLKLATKDPYRAGAVLKKAGWKQEGDVSVRGASKHDTLMFSSGGVKAEVRLIDRGEVGVTFTGQDLTLTK